MDKVDEYVPMVDPPPVDPRVAHLNRDGSVYEGQGLVLDFEPVVDAELSRPIAEEEQVAGEDNRDYVVQEDEPSRSVKEAQPTDYTLYKCQGCGQMVMGFDREEHVREVHEGVDCGFNKLL